MQEIRGIGPDGRAPPADILVYNPYHQKRPDLELQPESSCIE
ncbi:hypothetical protein GJA_5373 [Janthinobacterium agaricidamnosum NBRC 102515 = DSM 9628]|uniref:Uncharacterized protein n=1 Tax=Janthinobacterium agaricidamnosum NBRC 102515 = DSM 9628 TaxID=1349767 RepID=W0VB01_9BURK|nr:hypothetical protein GJA_5373 [Janthinobacterium agaricidamnosum NBRC 102515 = DSM 9628]